MNVDANCEGARGAPKAGEDPNPDQGGDLATRICTAVCDGMETRMVEVECSFTRGFAGMQLIGNATEVCRDGKERARSALECMGLVFPQRRLVVSLTPADIKKDGNHLDLAVAVSLGILIGGKRVSLPEIERWLFVGELGLLGEVKPVRGIVSFVIAAASAGFNGVVFSRDNLREVVALAGIPLSNFENLKILPVEYLREVFEWIWAKGSETGSTCAGPESLAFFCSQQRLNLGVNLGSPSKQRRYIQGDVSFKRLDAPDFDDMVLSQEIETAVLATATGLHSMLMRGAPGTGKSMLAMRLPSVLPLMEHEEHLEAMRIHSAFEHRLSLKLLEGFAPYRAPHHQASAAAVLGTPDMPGEVSLAHGGVLFLDEVPEFRRDLLEALREPLETGEVRVSRSKRKVFWKAKFVLLAACNNCPCGWRGSRRRRCDCAAQKEIAYNQRLSGPLQDRIDIHLNIPELDGDPAALFQRLSGSPEREIEGGGSNEIPRIRTSGQTVALAKRVRIARAFGKIRNRRLGVEFNRDLQAWHLLMASGLSHQDDFARLVNSVFPRSIGSRTLIRSLRVARTLADLKGEMTIDISDVRQAWSWQSEQAALARSGEVLF